MYLTSSLKRGYLDILKRLPFVIPMKTLFAVLLMSGSLMANDTQALLNQIMQGASESSARDQQRADQISAQLHASEAATEARNNAASIVNAINGASAFSTTANPYQPIPAR